MDPTAAVNLALIALQAVLQLITQIKSQSGLTDDQILAEAQNVSGANDTLYATLKATLNTPTA